MENTLDPMDLKHIITLHIEGYSNRKIGTFSKYLQQHGKHVCAFVYRGRIHF